MSGSLSQTNVSILFRDIYLSRRNGILRLVQGETKKSIYFISGEIVFAHSNIVKERLGETLLRLGKITVEEFEVASRDVIEKGKRLGQALWERGFLSLAEVNASVGYQLQQIVFSVFNWDTGNYVFVERDRPVFEDIVINMSTPQLLLEGVRNISNPNILKRIYSDDEDSIVHAAEEKPLLSRTDLEFAEETILACVDGRKSIRRLRELTRFTSIEFDRALYSLLLCGIICLKKNELTGQAEMTASAGRPFDYQTQPTPDNPSRPQSGSLRTWSEEEVRRQIQKTDERLEAMTDEEVLGLLPGATHAELRQAFERKTQLFYPAFSSPNRYSDFKEPLRRILERVNSAYQTLLQKSEFVVSLEEDSNARGPSRESAAPYVVAQTLDVISQVALQDATMAQLQDRLITEPNNTALMRLLSKRLLESGKPFDAEKQLLRALELEPQNIANHFALAEFYENRSLKFKAFRHLKIVLQLDPGNEKASTALGISTRRKPLYEIHTQKK